MAAAFPIKLISAGDFIFLSSIIKLSQKTKTLFDSVLAIELNKLTGSMFCPITPILLFLFFIDENILGKSFYPK
ncbi:MAG: hypothetical protein QF864_02855 [SAR202 cluster bacterium]|nr:hypothetical protein [SAR202 cluster bacterium]